MLGFGFWACMAGLWLCCLENRLYDSQAIRFCFTEAILVYQAITGFTGSGHSLCYHGLGFENGYVWLLVQVSTGYGSLGHGLCFSGFGQAGQQVMVLGSDMVQANVVFNRLWNKLMVLGHII